MKDKFSLFLIAVTAPVFCCVTLGAQLPDDLNISPSRPVPTGKAPGMQVKQIKDTTEEKVYAVIFHKGDEALRSLTDFSIRSKMRTLPRSVPQVALHWHSSISRKNLSSNPCDRTG
jgi:hypothetical protein